VGALSLCISSGLNTLGFVPSRDNGSTASLLHVVYFLDTRERKTSNIHQLKKIAPVRWVAGSNPARGMDVCP
jgi:hypothetical protein